MAADGVTDLERDKRGREKDIRIDYDVDACLIF